MKAWIAGAALAYSALAASQAPPTQSASSAAGLTEFRLRYEVSWGSMVLGDAEISLQCLEAPGCYRYRSVTRPVALVRMVIGTPSEISEFCVEHGRVSPRRFEFIDPKSKSESFSLLFDPVARTVKSSRGDVRPLPDNAQDRFGLHQAVRLWLMGAAGRSERGNAQFSVVEDERIKQYELEVTGEQTVKTPAGRFKTLVVERVKDRKKQTKFWIAPELDWMPVKVERIRNGEVEFRMVLAS